MLMQLVPGTVFQVWFRDGRCSLCYNCETEFGPVMNHLGTTDSFHFALRTDCLGF